MDFSNNRIDTQRRTAVYVRISTAMQKTDRQVEELVAFAKSNRLNFDESTDIYKDIISGFKDGEDRPNFSILMTKLELGEYQQVLFSEFSRLERKPSNLLRTLETLQKQNVYCWFNKQSIWVKDKNDIGTQIMIQVLAVLSQYEIELFTARGIDGKITALKTRGTTNGGPSPYGYRHSTFYEPDPANPKPAYKRTDRHILTEFEVELPELRIVDDETFAQANAVIENRHLNKNVGVHRENLLKTLLVCGECGSRFCTALSTSGPTYKCSAKIKRGCTPRTCLFGADVQQSKLDGRPDVQQLCKESHPRCQGRC